MRILFLDDDANRHERFMRNSIGHIVYQAWGYSDAVQFLAECEPFDQAHLDHDLSDMAAAGTPAQDEKTGTHVAEYIANMPPEKRPRLVVLHSFNDAGWRRMARILNEAGVTCMRRPRGRKRCGVCSDSKQAGRRRRERLAGLDDVRQLGSAKVPEWWICGACAAKAVNHEKTAPNSRSGPKRKGGR